ncbi:hypothetical protein AA14337_0610 [Acetobacter malorum DSM 14337]|uniref:Phenazine biosynthesis PhzC/PhzF protein n=1 Tax=Acetobacter malorum DSM 14337 TaxID=1307910 RepID=A0ABQ0PNN9_9PROT|nr:hypothetical protein AA14337_0610 [Acetobacter malorum DSM 14337]
MMMTPPEAPQAVQTFGFQQVDVFSAVPLRGNPLAVVENADTLPDAKMAALAHWTNLSDDLSPEPQSARCGLPRPYFYAL